MNLMELQILMWQRLNAEVLQAMKMLDIWTMFIIGLLVVLLLVSRLEGFQDVIVWAALLGAVSTIWIGRLDVLIHRPVPATIEIEKDVNARLLQEGSAVATYKDGEVLPSWKTWELWYKPLLKTGVKILVPLDALAGIFLFAMFILANNATFRYLAGTWYQSYFYWGCVVLHFIGWGIITSAKPLAE